MPSTFIQIDCPSLINLNLLLIQNWSISISILYSRRTEHLASQIRTKISWTVLGPTKDPDIINVVNRT